MEKGRACARERARERKGDGWIAGGKGGKEAKKKRRDRDLLLGREKERRAFQMWHTDTLVKFFSSFRPSAKEAEDTRGIQATLRPLREKKAKANNRQDLLYTYFPRPTNAITADVCNKLVCTRVVM